MLGQAARAVADKVGGLALTADLSRESEVLRVIAQTEAHYGPIGLFCSNAGVGPPTGGVEVPDDGWQTHWNIHVMAHVWAARALAPAMARRGEGYLLSTASAAGLLMAPGAVPYTVTKQAALALAESLAVLYHGNGVLLTYRAYVYRVRRKDDAPGAHLAGQFCTESPNWVDIPR
jgi:NAD(P)-dependent dehydrogenase (short-subunit alcohol dehydrogenase family)